MLESALSNHVAGGDTEFNGPAGDRKLANTGFDTPLT